MRIGPFKKSKGNIQSVDVLIIGGNLTGISTAFNLANKLKIMVVDKSFIGNNLFNKIQTVALNNFDYKKISNIFSEKYMNMYFNFLLETTDILRDNIIKNDLRCNLLVGNKDEDKNIAVIDFKGFIDGTPFEGGEGHDYNLEIGSGSFIGDFEQQLIGLEKGQSKDVNVTFPENYGREELNGKEAN